PGRSPGDRGGSGLRRDIPSVGSRRGFSAGASEGVGPSRGSRVAAGIAGVWGMLMARRAKRVGLVGVVLMIGGVLAWGVPSWWYRHTLGTARNEYSLGRYASARGRLAALESWWPVRLPEEDLLLGLCERA